MPEQLKLEGVLFIYNGTETCFWPPLYRKPWFIEGVPLLVAF
jgi:hypothetical protein